MWRRDDFAKAMSDVIGDREDGYKELFSSDVLREFLLTPIMVYENEFRIWDMLVKQGLIEEMGKLPYNDKTEAYAAKPNVKKFLDSYAIVPDVQAEIFYLMDTVFVKPRRPDYTKNQALVALMGWANKQLFEESKLKERQLVLEKDTKFDDVVTYAVDELRIGATYEGDLPAFQRYPNLVKLSVFFWNAEGSFRYFACV